MDTQQHRDVGALSPAELGAILEEPEPSWTCRAEQVGVAHALAEHAAWLARWAAASAELSRRTSAVLDGGERTKAPTLASRPAGSRG